MVSLRDSLRRAFFKIDIGDRYLRCHSCMDSPKADEPRSESGKDRIGHRPGGICYRDHTVILQYRLSGPKHKSIFYKSPEIRLSLHRHGGHHKDERAIKGALHRGVSFYDNHNP